MSRVIHLWDEPFDPIRKILTEDGKIAFDPACCCESTDDACCGRYMPGSNGGVNEYPSTLNYEIHGITVGPCWTGDEVGVATWDAVESAWIDEITMDGCNHPGTIRITCQNRVADTGTCGDESWGSNWVGSLIDITPCVDPGDPLSGSVDFFLTATLPEPDCFCDPLILESDNITMGGIGCCGVLMGNAVVQVSVWE